MTELFSTNVCKKHIKVRIAEIETNLAHATQDDIANGQAASDKVQALIDKALQSGQSLTESEKAEVSTLLNLSNLYHQTKELDRLRVTLGKNLVKVNSTYIACSDKALVSPAGFSHSDRVFVQPKVAIYSNSLLSAKDVPSTDTPLYLFNVDDACID